MTPEQEKMLTIGLIAIETLKAVMDELGIDRSDIQTGTDVVNAVKARIEEISK